MLRLGKKRYAEKSIIPSDESKELSNKVLKKDDYEECLELKIHAETEQKITKEEILSAKLESLIYSRLESEDEDSELEDVTQVKYDPKPSAWSDSDDDEEFGYENFEKVMGATPDWAKPKTVDPTLEHFNNDLLTTESHHLPHTLLDIVKCVDLNKEDRSSQRLEVCEFHPNARMAMTASKDCRLNLFQVDGKKNAKIHSLFMQKFPIVCAHFLTGGNEVLMTSNQPHVYAYDLQSGKVDKKSFIKGVRDQKLNKFKVSPNGKHLVFLSKYGKMYVVDQKTKELIKVLKMCDSVEDICFFNNGNSMMSYGGDGTVYTWDMNSLLCTSTFEHEAGFNGLSIDCTSDGKLFACGTSSGCVDLFDADTLKVQKTFKNILSPITTLKFNNSGEILGMASDDERTAIKLVHSSQQSVFSNFPLIDNRFMGEIKTLAFSPNDGYMAVANTSGRALLYRLNHYSSY